VEPSVSGLIEGYKSGNELVKQLITLATGILAISITFTKDILKGVPRSTRLIKLAWLGYLLSICFGVWAMMAFSGMIIEISLVGITDTTKQDKYGSSVMPLLAQIVSFIFATSLLIAFGFKSLKSLMKSEVTE
jgi:hypothetical protein